MKITSQLGQKVLHSTPTCFQKWTLMVLEQHDVVATTPTLLMTSQQCDWLVAVMVPEVNQLRCCRNSTSSAK